MVVATHLKISVELMVRAPTWIWIVDDNGWVAPGLNSLTVPELILERGQEVFVEDVLCVLHNVPELRRLFGSVRVLRQNEPKQSTFGKFPVGDAQRLSDLARLLGKNLVVIVDYGHNPAVRPGEAARRHFKRLAEFAPDGHQIG
ncbi:MAG: hypothetical protein HYV77_01835 [Candidatus Wildermuthbacteria bacterium]|nr:hypothetical protein [Candidatus Wildermuthbacteria bacterium]